MRLNELQKNYLVTCIGDNVFSLLKMALPNRVMAKHDYDGGTLELQTEIAISFDCYKVWSEQEYESWKVSGDFFESANQLLHTLRIEFDKYIEQQVLAAAVDQCRIKGRDPKKILSKPKLAYLPVFLSIEAAFEKAFRMLSALNEALNKSDMSRVLEHMNTLGNSERKSSDVECKLAEVTHKAATLEMQQKLLMMVLTQNASGDTPDTPKLGAVSITRPASAINTPGGDGKVSSVDEAKETQSLEAVLNKDAAVSNESLAF